MKLYRQQAYFKTPSGDKKYIIDRHKRFTTRGKADADTENHISTMDWLPPITIYIDITEVNKVI